MSQLITELYIHIYNFCLEYWPVKRTFTLFMIKSFKSKELKILWEERKNHKLPSGQLLKINMILEVIDSAEKVPHDFLFFRSWKIHPLKGNKAGIWSLTVQENWRIIFRFEHKNAFDIDYLDYH